MIGALVVTFARQRLTSPMRLLLALMFFALSMMPVLLTGSLGMLTPKTTNLFAFVFAAGLIGQDVSSGVLTLAFARPLRRLEYVLARGLGAAALTLGCVVLQVLAAALAALLRHGEPTLMEVAQKLVECALPAVGLVAVLLMLSALVPGLADLGLYVLGMIGGAVIGGIGQAKDVPVLTRAGQEINRFLDPTLDLGVLFGRGTLSWFELASYLSTIAICLVIAVWAVNRRELSYAAG